MKLLIINILALTCMVECFWIDALDAKLTKEKNERREDNYTMNRHLDVIDSDIAKLREDVGYNRADLDNYRFRGSEER